MNTQALETTSVLQLSDWILLAPSGKRAIYRHPVNFIPDGCVLASGLEFFVAHRGNPFPWGHLPEPSVHNRHWKSFSLGVGGLFHERWFVTSDGRFGGAANVPCTLPGSLRRCLYLDGGESSAYPPILEENEGYAISRETSFQDQLLYRKVQLHAAKHVMADGGAIITSPLLPNGRVQVGFVGRCQTCPNAEAISFEQLKKAVPDFNFELWPEWRNWRLNSPEPLSTISLKNLPQSGQVMTEPGM